MGKISPYASVDLLNKQEVLPDIHPSTLKMPGDLGKAYRNTFANTENWALSSYLDQYS